MSTTATLITLEQFFKHPGERIELYDGVVVKRMPPPKRKHTKIQNRLLDFLRSVAPKAYFVDKELGFAVPTANYRVADVAAVTMERRNQDNLDDYLFGAPELVIEVVSSRNRLSMLRKTRKVCLLNGCKFFWIVDPKNREIDVTDQDWITKTYREGENVPVALFPGSIAVTRIFED